jgi:hypothetical protein
MTMYYKNQIIFPISFSIVGCGQVKPIPNQVDLGSIEPGGVIHTMVSLKNPFSTTARITGLEKACSVKITAPFNGVLEPGQSVELDVSGRAPRIPGPTAARITLGIVSGNKEIPFVHQINYLIMARPFISRTELWMSQGRSTVHVFGLSKDTRVECEATEGLGCSVSGTNVYVVKNAEIDQNASVRISFNNESLVLPVHEESSLSNARLYPEVITTVRGRVTTVKLINLRNGLLIRAEDKRVNVKFDPTTGVATLSSLATLQTRIIVFDGYKEVSHATMFVD